MQGVVQRTGSGQALGEFVEGGQVGDPAGQPILNHRAGRGLSGRDGGQVRRSVRVSRNR